MQNVDDYYDDDEKRAMIIANASVALLLYLSFAIYIATALDSRSILYLTTCQRAVRFSLASSCNGTSAKGSHK